MGGRLGMGQGPPPLGQRARHHLVPEGGGDLFGLSAPGPSASLVQASSSTRTSVRSSRRRRRDRRAPPPSTPACMLKLATVSTMRPDDRPPVPSGVCRAGRQLLAERLRSFTTTIFSEMSELALATGSLNLGQGFPDTDGPAELVHGRRGHRGRAQSVPAEPGMPELRAAVAAHQASWYGLDFSPDDEVLVTTGATEAIAATLLALCEPGDEVVMFEPSYDSYAACVSMAGATPRLVRLHPPTGRSTPTSWPPPSVRAPGSSCSTPPITRPARCSARRSSRRSPRSAATATSWR